ncbi:DUF4231 domain-containing protein [Ktedonosporobacter rubrisoli]|uniref:DUF4231 domain-containing protein n=1 Tax=Ktedonosporobacter rubrisoli TaxID=2509675 RepID=A0A4P6JN60_KTERU|nr:DUF4231 domain-containing protein [Ktedonosporobacter rubrisoli]QBD76156.1 DUF4231 domain-containing protein [Ktedonosporobacter rubrisoli]
MQPLTNNAEQYLKGRWQQQYDYYSQQAIYNKRWHQSLLLFSTIGALVVPVLLNIADIPKLVPTILSMLVSIALALEGVYHYGDSWRLFRQALEALKEERALYEAGAAAYMDPQKAFPLFVERCEDIMQIEGKGYFERHKLKKLEPNL